MRDIVINGELIEDGSGKS